MTGTLYRFAIAVKDLGERLRLSGVIRMGLRIKEIALRGKVK